jgi:hypothetical protein
MCQSPVSVGKLISVGETTFREENYSNKETTPAWETIFVRRRPQEDRYLC